VAAIAAKLRDWFGRPEPPLRTALGLALGFRSSADDAVRRIIEYEVSKSISWVVRRGDLIAYLPSRSGSPRENEEPYINSPVLEAIRVARRLQAGAEEQTANLSLVPRLTSEPETRKIGGRQFPPPLFVLRRLAYPGRPRRQ
jgi:hypothetical protein